jgi:AcrR family transcriptional regulator
MIAPEPGAAQDAAQRKRLLTARHNGWSRRGGAGRGLIGRAGEDALADALRSPRSLLTRPTGSTTEVLGVDLSGLGEIDNSAFYIDDADPADPQMVTVVFEVKNTRMAPDPQPAAAVGRPRRYDAETEVRLIFDAALAVMRRNGYEKATVADILAEAGMSTRAFYRHFGSKDELLCAMYRRDAERSAERLRARVQATGSNRDALVAWIDEVLSFGHDPAKAERVAVLGSAGAMRAAGADEERRHAAKLIIGPLMEILEAGKADGTFPAVQLPADAHLIRAAVWEAAGLSAAGDAKAQWPHSREAVVSFCLRSVGALR